MYTNCVWVTLRLFPHFGIVSFDIDMKRKHWSPKFLFPNCIWVSIQMRIATDDSIVSGDYGDYCERALRKTPIHWHEKNKLGDRLRCVLFCVGWYACVWMCAHMCVTPYAIWEVWRNVSTVDGAPTQQTVKIIWFPFDDVHIYGFICISKWVEKPAHRRCVGMECATWKLTCYCKFYYKNREHIFINISAVFLFISIGMIRQTFLKYAGTWHLFSFSPSIIFMFELPLKKWLARNCCLCHQSYHFFVLEPIRMIVRMWHKTEKLYWRSVQYAHWTLCSVHCTVLHCWVCTNYTREWCRAKNLCAIGHVAMQPAAIWMWVWCWKRSQSCIWDLIELHTRIHWSQ